MTDNPEMNEPDRGSLEELSDDELDAWILVRLHMLGVDLSVLPEDEEDAPADQRRILASAREFLRSTPPVIAGFEMDALGVPPAIYPSELLAWTGACGGD